MGRKVGIDLGTTNSVVAYSEGSKARVIVNSKNERTTPSIVLRQNGRSIVGEDARVALGDPVLSRNCITSVKRLMGRQFTDPEVQQVQKHVHYQIKPHGNLDEVRIAVDNETLSPEVVSAEILKKLKADAEQSLGGDKITDAIITVPAGFSDLQRIATREAGKLAGLNVLRILEEPCAAAYAYGFELSPLQNKMLAVYDMGGGTFDVSIVHVGGIANVETNKGDMWLGGDRFDEKIMDHVLRETDRKHRGIEEELRADAGFMLELKVKSEQAKRLLDSYDQTAIVIKNALGRLDIKETITRRDYVSWVAPDIRKTIALLSEALEFKDLVPEAIDNVLLVGGGTAFPLVREALAELFGDKKILKSDPMHCVAEGAALLAEVQEKTIEDEGYLPEPKKKREKIELVTHADYGIALSRGGDGEMDTKVIIERGTHYYPESATFEEEFRTVRDQQDTIHVDIYEDKQWRGHLEVDIDEDKRGEAGAPVVVSMKVDKDGVLTVGLRGERSLKGVAKSVRLDETAGEIKYCTNPSGQHANPADARGPCCVCHWPLQTDDLSGRVCPRCGRTNPMDAVECEGCQSRLEEEEKNWELELVFHMVTARSLLRDFPDLLGKKHVSTLASLVSKGEECFRSNDEAAGRVLLDKFRQEYLDIVQEMGKTAELMFLCVLARALLALPERITNKSRLTRSVDDAERLLNRSGRDGARDDEIDSHVDNVLKLLEEATQQEIGIVPKICKNCGHVNPGGVEYCMECHLSLTIEGR